MKICNQIPKAQVSQAKVLTLFIGLILLVLCMNTHAMAQENDQMVRFAKIKVDPDQLAEYTKALKEQMTTAVRVEPGVLSYFAVADKSDPSLITILEIYSDSAAYQSHIITPHFLKYKETVQNMVQSLELVDLDVISSARKPDM